MSDIFNRTSDAFGGSFSADQARVTFPALGDKLGALVGLVMQTLASQFTQQISRVFEIGTPFHYLVAGRAAGQLSISRIHGPRKLTAAFYKTYGDVCRARTNSLHFSVQTGCDAQQSAAAQQSNKSTFVCHFLVVTSVGFNLRAEDMLINEALAATFSSFMYD